MSWYSEILCARGHFRPIIMARRHCWIKLWKWMMSLCSKLKAHNIFIVLLLKNAQFVTHSFFTLLEYSLNCTEMQVESTSWNPKTTQKSPALQIGKLDLLGFLGIERRNKHKRCPPIYCFFHDLMLKHPSISHKPVHPVSKWKFSKEHWSKLCPSGDFLVSFISPSPWED